MKYLGGFNIGELMQKRGMLQLAILFLVSTLLSSVAQADCCANLGTKSWDGYCTDGIINARCCPGSYEVGPGYPTGNLDCNVNYWSSQSCSDYSKCVLGCCCDYEADHTISTALECTAASANPAKPTQFIAGITGLSDCRTACQILDTCNDGTLQPAEECDLSVAGSTVASQCTASELPFGTCTDQKACTNCQCTGTLACSQPGCRPTDADYQKYCACEGLGEAACRADTANCAFCEKDSKCYPKAQVKCANDAGCTTPPNSCYTGPNQCLSDCSACGYGELKCDGSKCAVESPDYIASCAQCVGYNIGQCQASSACTWCTQATPGCIPKPSQFCTQDSQCTTPPAPASCYQAQGSCTGCSCVYARKPGYNTDCTVDCNAYNANPAGCKSKYPDCALCGSNCISDCNADCGGTVANPATRMCEAIPEACTGKDQAECMTRYGSNGDCLWCPYDTGSCVGSCSTCTDYPINTQGEPWQCDTGVSFDCSTVADGDRVACIQHQIDGCHYCPADSASADANKCMDDCATCTGYTTDDEVPFGECDSAGVGAEGFDCGGIGAEAGCSAQYASQGCHWCPGNPDGSKCVNSCRGQCTSRPNDNNPVDYLCDAAAFACDTLQAAETCQVESARHGCTWCPTGTPGGTNCLVGCDSCPGNLNTNDGGTCVLRCESIEAEGPCNANNCAWCSTATENPCSSSCVSCPTLPIRNTATNICEVDAGSILCESLPTKEACIDTSHNCRWCPGESPSFSEPGSCVTACNQCEDFYDISDTDRECHLSEPACARNRDPPTITEIKHIRGSYELEIYWQLDCDSSTLTGYNVWRCDDAEVPEGTNQPAKCSSPFYDIRNENVIPSSTKGFTDTIQKPSQHYCYEIEAIYDSGSKRSGIVCVKSGDRECLDYSNEFCLMAAEGDSQPEYPSVRGNCNCVETCTAYHAADPTFTGSVFTNTKTTQLCDSGWQCIGPKTNGRTSCAKREPCDDCNGILGMFADYATSYVVSSDPDNPERPKDVPCRELEYCYFDYSDTIADTFRDCSQVKTCYDYGSRRACEGNEFDDWPQNNNCLDHDCEWITTPLSELGTGICRPVEEEHQKCNLCLGNLDGMHNRIFNYCTADVCEALGNCYANYLGGDVYCYGAEEMKCEFYNTQQDCINGQKAQTNVRWGADGEEIIGYPYDHPTNPPNHLTPSKDVMGLGVCKYTDEKGCYKDADNNPITTERSADRTPPKTNILSPQRLSEFLLDVYVEDEANTVNLYTCYVNRGDVCVPGHDGLGSNKKPMAANERATLDAYKEAGHGHYTLYYFSDDGANNHNLEEVGKLDIDIDTAAPNRVGDPVYLQSKDEARSTAESEVSNLVIRVTLDEPAKCTHKLERDPGVWFMPEAESFATELSAIFPHGSKDEDNPATAKNDALGLADGRYRYTLTCRDDLNDPAVVFYDDDVRIAANREIGEPLPSGIVGSAAVQLSVTTYSRANCQWSRAGQADWEQFEKQEVDRKFIHTYLHTAIPNVRNNIDVTCNFPDTGKIVSDEISFMVDTIAPTAAAWKAGKNAGGSRSGPSQMFDFTRWHRANEPVFLDCQDLPANGLGCEKVLYCLEELESTCRGDYTFEEITGTAIGVTPIPIPSSQYLCYKAKETGGRESLLQCGYIKVDSLRPELVVNELGKDSSAPLVVSSTGYTISGSVFDYEFTGPEGLAMQPIGTTELGTETDGALAVSGPQIIDGYVLSDLAYSAAIEVQDGWTDIIFGYKSNADYYFARVNMENSNPAERSLEIWHTSGIIMAEPAAIPTGKYIAKLNVNSGSGAVSFAITTESGRPVASVSNRITANPTGQLGMSSTGQPATFSNIKVQNPRLSNNQVEITYENTYILSAQNDFSLPISQIKVGEVVPIQFTARDRAFNGHPGAPQNYFILVDQEGPIIPDLGSPGAPMILQDSVDGPVEFGQGFKVTVNIEESFGGSIGVTAQDEGGVSQGLFEVTSVAAKVLSGETTLAERAMTPGTGTDDHPWKATWEGTFNINFPDIGDYALEITATDKSGNTRKKIYPGRITVTDTTPPVITLDMVYDQLITAHGKGLELQEDGTRVLTIYPSGQIQITGKVTELKLDRVEIIASHTLEGGTEEESKLATINPSDGADVAFAASITLSQLYPGVNHIKAKAHDEMGGIGVWPPEGSGETYTITRDTTAPVIDPASVTWTQKCQGAEPTTLGEEKKLEYGCGLELTLAFSDELTQNVKYSRVKWCPADPGNAEVNCGTAKEGNDASQTGLTYLFGPALTNPTKPGVYNRGVGDYTLQIVLRDALDNTATTALPFKIVDTKSPEIGLIISEGADFPTTITRGTAERRTYKLFIGSTSEPIGDIYREVGDGKVRAEGITYTLSEEGKTGCLAPITEITKQDDYAWSAELFVPTDQCFSGYEGDAILNFVIDDHNGVRVQHVSGAQSKITGPLEPMKFRIDTLGPAAPILFEGQDFISRDENGKLRPYFTSRQTRIFGTAEPGSTVVIDHFRDDVRVNTYTWEARRDAGCLEAEYTLYTAANENDKAIEITQPEAAQLAERQLFFTDYPRSTFVHYYVQSKTVSNGRAVFELLNGLESDIPAGAKIKVCSSPYPTGYFQYTFNPDEGRHKIRMSAIDEYGNSGEPTEWYVFVKDTTAPEVTAATPEDGTYTGDDVAAIIAKLSDTASGIDCSTITLDINYDDLAGSTRTCTGGCDIGAGCADGAEEFEVYLNSGITTENRGWAVFDTDAEADPGYGDLDDGRYTVTLGASDIAGNEMPAKTWTFTLDNRLPHTPTLSCENCGCTGSDGNPAACTSDDNGILYVAVQRPALGLYFENDNGRYISTPAVTKTPTLSTAPITVTRVEVGDLSSPDRFTLGFSWNLGEEFQGPGGTIVSEQTLEIKAYKCLQESCRGNPPAEGWSNQATLKRQFVVDLTDPVLTLDSLEAANTPYPKVTGSFVEKNLRYIKFYGDVKEKSIRLTEEQKVAMKAGAVAFSADLEFATQAPGKKTIRALAYDRTGRASEEQAIEVIYDNEAPAAETSYGYCGSWVSEDQEFTFIATDAGTKPDRIFYCEDGETSCTITTAGDSPSDSRELTDCALVNAPAEPAADDAGADSQAGSAEAETAGIGDTAGISAKLVASGGSAGGAGSGREVEADAGSPTEPAPPDELPPSELPAQPPEGQVWQCTGSMPIGPDPGVQTYDHAIRFIALDRAGNPSQVQACNVKIDKSLPVTVLSYGLPDVETPPELTAACPNNNNCIWPADLTITLGSACAGRCAKTLYCEGTGCTPDIEYTGRPFTIETDGFVAKTIRYTSENNAGVSHPPAEVTIKIDKAAPTISTTDVFCDSWSSNAPTVTFTAVDEGTGPVGIFYCTGAADAECTLPEEPVLFEDGKCVKSGSTTTCTVQVTFGPAEGDKTYDHTLRYRTRDAAGNPSEEKTCRIMVDTDTPETHIKYGLEGSDDPFTGCSDDSDCTWGENVIVRLESDCPDSGCEWTKYCTTFGCNYRDGTSNAGPVLVSAADGTENAVTFRYGSRSNVGRDETQKEVLIKVDKKAPVISNLAVADPSGGTGTVVDYADESTHDLKKKTKVCIVTFSGTVDEKSTVLIDVDSGSLSVTRSGNRFASAQYVFSSCSGRQEKVITITATDTVGLAATKTILLVLDKRAPAITLTDPRKVGDAYYTNADPAKIVATTDVASACTINAGLAVGTHAMASTDGLTHEFAYTIQQGRIDARNHLDITCTSSFSGVSGTLSQDFSLDTIPPDLRLGGREPGKPATETEGTFTLEHVTNGQVRAEIVADNIEDADKIRCTYTCTKDSANCPEGAIPVLSDPETFEDPKVRQVIYGPGIATYAYEVTCEDEAGNTDKKGLSIAVNLVDAFLTSEPWPSGYIAVHDTTVSIKTTQKAICKYTYGGAAVRFTDTGDLIHSEQLTGLADGTYSIPVTCASQEATIADATGTIAFRVETTPPAKPIITKPAEGDILGSSNIVVQGTAEAGTLIHFILNGVGLAATATTSGTYSPAAGTGTFSATIAAASAGDQTLTAKAEDGVGIEGIGGESPESGEVRFKIDSDGPANPVLWPIPAIANNPALKIIGYYGEAGITAKLADESYSDIPGATYESRRTPEACAEPGKTAAGTKGDTIVRVDNNGVFAVNSYLGFKTHERVHFKRYRITEANRNRIILADPLEANLSAAETVVCDQPTPDGWFEIPVTLQGGQNTFYVYAEDSFGNTGPLTEVKISLDASPPVIESRSPTGFISDIRAPISATIYDVGSEIKTASLRINDNTIPLVPGAADPSGKHFIKYDPAVDLERNLRWNDGINSVELTITDSAGNTVPSRWSFIVDQDLPPEPEITATSSKTYREEPNRIFTSSDSVQVNVKFPSGTIDVTEVKVGDTVIAGIWDGYENDAEISFTANLGHPQNIVSVKARRVLAVLSYSNEITFTKTIVFDRDDPAATINAPAIVGAVAGKPQALPLPLALTGTYEDANIYSIAIGGTTTGFAGIANPAQVSGTYSADLLLNGPDGVKTVAITPQDRAGNTAAPQVAEIILDTTPPAITIDTAALINDNSLRGADLKTSAGLVTVKGAYTEANIDSITSGSVQAAYSPGAFTMEVPLQGDPGELTVNKISIKATDKIGLSATANISITKDLRAPAVTVISPPEIAGSHFTSADQPEIVILTDEEASCTLEYTPKGFSEAFTEPLATSGLSHSLTLSNALKSAADSDTENILSVICADDIGNSGQTAARVIVDRTTPQIAAFSAQNAVPTAETGIRKDYLVIASPYTALSVRATEPVNCRYGDVTDFESMSGRFREAYQRELSTDFIQLEDGSSYQYYIRCEDRSGRITDFREVNVKVELSKQVIILDAGPNGTTNTRSPVIYVETMDNARCMVDREYAGILGILSDIWEAPVEMSAAGGTTYRHTAPEIEIEDGLTYRFDITCEDRSEQGYEPATITLEFTTDFAVSAPIIDMPATTEFAEVPVSGTVDQDVFRVVVTTPEGTFELPASGGRFSGTIRVGDGENAVTVKAIDAAGNEISVERAVTWVNLDPYISGTYPNDGAVLKELGQAWVTLEARDGQIDMGRSTLVLKTPSGNLAGSHRADGNKFTILFAKLADNPYQLEATAVDTKGRTAKETISFIIDSKIPELSLTQPYAYPAAHPPTLTSRGAVFAGHLQSPKPLTSAVFITNGAATDLMPQLGETGGSFTITATLAEGTNTFRVVATQAEGNYLDTGNVTIPVDTTGPAAKIIIEGGTPTVIRMEAFCGDAVCGFEEECTEDCLILNDIGGFEYDANEEYAEFPDRKAYTLSYSGTRTVAVSLYNKSITAMFNEDLRSGIFADSVKNFTTVSGNEIYILDQASASWVSERKIILILNLQVGSPLPQGLVEAYLEKYPSTLI
ncbi:MAG: hypothetical protein ABH879_04630 [archaeon]